MGTLKSVQLKTVKLVSGTIILFACSVITCFSVALAKKYLDKNIKALCLLIFLMSIKHTYMKKGFLYDD